MLEHAQRAEEAMEQAPTVLFEDETTFRGLPPLRGMSMRRGQQTRVAVPESNGTFALYGVLNPFTGSDLHGPVSESQELLHRSVSGPAHEAGSRAGALDLGSRFVAYVAGDGAQLKR